MSVSPDIAPQFVSAGQQSGAATLGMWVFLATELMFFGPLFLGYAYGRLNFAPAFAEASRHTDMLLGTLNTAVLLTSSFLMANAVTAAEADAGEGRYVRLFLLGTALLGVVFLVVKGVEYRHEWHEHLFPGAVSALRPQAQFFFVLYFVMTGLHALHLLIGIGVVLVMATGISRRPTLASPQHLRLAGLYWHFVDMVWIFLYPILYLVGRAA